MLFMPFQVLGIWFRGLLTLVLLGAGIFLLTRWYNHREVIVPERVYVGADDRREQEGRPADAEGQPVAVERQRVVRWQFGFNRETAYLLGGLALLGWSLGGGWVASPRLFRRAGGDDPKPGPAGAEQRLRMADGTEIRVQVYGPADGDPVVLTHGWGLDVEEWCYARNELGVRHRLITWDLPGLGASSRPPDRDWSLEKLAGYLDAVIGVAGGKPVALVGHSIGGMILLTYCKRFPGALGTRVRSLVIAQSTYTNPVNTADKAALYQALQKPILEPLCHLLVWLSPLVRVMNALSYLNGSAHRSTERTSFSGNETRGQLDFMTRYYLKAAPDVVGRGMLAMFRYDATDVLGRIGVPTLVVTGDRDEVCVPGASRFMAEAIPGAKLVTLEQARHCGLFEYHGEFHTVVREFLTARGAAAGAAAPTPTAALVPGDGHGGSV